MQTCSDTFTDKDRLKSLLYMYECKRDSLNSKKIELEAELTEAEAKIRTYKNQLRISR